MPDPAVEREREHVVLAGDVSDELATGGCRFKARCPVGRDRDICGEEEPAFIAHESGQLAACHFPDELHRLVEASASEES